MFNFLHNIIMKKNSLKPFKFAVASILKNFPQFFNEDSFSDHDFLDSLKLIERILSDFIFRVEKFLEDDNNE